jgi:hypothetical protein
VEGSGVADCCCVVWPAAEADRCLSLRLACGVPLGHYCGLSAAAPKERWPDNSSGATPHSNDTYTVHKLTTPKYSG